MAPERQPLELPESLEGYSVSQNKALSDVEMTLGITFPVPIMMIELHGRNLNVLAKQQGWDYVHEVLDEFSDGVKGYYADDYEAMFVPPDVFARLYQKL